MKAKITHPHGYKCAPEGHTIVHFDTGSIVEGAIAEMAIADGAATIFRDAEIEAKVVTPAEVKEPAEVVAKIEPAKKGRTRK